MWLAFSLVGCTVVCYLAPSLSALLSIRNSWGACTIYKCGGFSLTDSDSTGKGDAIGRNTRNCAFFQLLLHLNCP